MTRLPQCTWQPARSWRPSMNLAMIVKTRRLIKSCLVTACSALVLLVLSPLQAATVDAIWNSASDVPVTAAGYAATGSSINFTLNSVLPTGTNLTVVRNTGLDFITGTFSNLAQGQAVALSYDGLKYHFVANYYGGSGNDLILHWAGVRPMAWGD